MFSSVIRAHIVSLYLCLHTSFLLIFSVDTICCPPTHTLHTSKDHFPSFHMQFQQHQKLCIPPSEITQTAQRRAIPTPAPCCIRCRSTLFPPCALSPLRHCVNAAHVETQAQCLLLSVMAAGGMQRHDLSGLREDQSRREHLPTWADMLDPCALNCIVGGRHLAVFSSLLSRLHHTGGVIHCTLFAVKHIMKEKKVLSLAFWFPISLAVLYTTLLSSVVNLSSV